MPLSIGTRDEVELFKLCVKSAEKSTCRRIFAVCAAGARRCARRREVGGRAREGARGDAAGGERPRAVAAKPRTAPMARRRDEDIAPYRNGTAWQWGTRVGVRRRGAGDGARAMFALAPGLRCSAFDRWGEFW